MESLLTPEIIITGSTSFLVPEMSKKKTKKAPLSIINALQYRAVRYVCFMLEDSKNEITTEDFIKEAIARHLTFYQTKRGIEFPPKMLAELNKVEMTHTKPTPTE